MNKLYTILVLSLTILIYSCGSELNEEDYNVGPNGEPPKIHEEKYSHQFKIEEKNYVLALGIIHKFLITNSFYPIIYTDCFDKTSEKKVLFEKNSQIYPCLVLRAEKGCPVKSYLTVKIEEVKFNQIDNDNRLILLVKIHGVKNSHYDISQDFKVSVESELNKLYGTTKLGVP